MKGRYFLITLGRKPAAEPGEIYKIYSDPGDNFRIYAKDFAYAPFIREENGDTVVVLGSPTLNDGINKEAVAKNYLENKGNRGYLKNINGEFLIIHYDAFKKSLVVINDRFCAIPFYYAATDGFLMGSIYYSDLWLLLKKTGLLKAETNAFFEFIWLQRLIGSKTYDALSRYLPPASVMEYNFKDLAVGRYWRPDFTKNGKKSVDAYARDLSGLLKASVMKKTSDHKKSGLFLSGGMDTRTVLSAFANDRLPLCFTVGFGRTKEAEIAQRVAAIRGAEHRFIELGPDHYERIFGDAAALTGGMYVFDHAIFLGLDEFIKGRIDTLFHGHGLDYFFQGMYVPAKIIKIFGCTTFLRRLRKLDRELSRDFLANINYRLKNVDTLKYLKNSYRQKTQECLYASVEELLKEGRELSEDPYDLWEYMLIHALSRHYTNPNISSLNIYAEQRTISFDNDIFDLYLSLPVHYRLGGRVLKKTLEILNKELSELPSANTGLKICGSDMELTLRHILRHARRFITGNTGYRHPALSDRTWPSREKVLYASKFFRHKAVNLTKSENLAAFMPFLDIDALNSDIRKWDASSSGGADLIFTLLTIDEFFNLTLKDI